MKYYKVLVNGKSFHGGNLEWSLPKNGKPGKWHKVEGNLLMCVNGLHLTSEPARWWHEGAECYEAKFDAKEMRQDDNKICVRRARLIRKVDDLAEVQIFYQDKHVVRSGLALAYGSSSVVAWDSSSVLAYGSSSVVAWGSSSVVAWVSSSVKAYGSSSVVAWDSSSVLACDSSSVVAYGSSSVKAYGSSSVVAYGSSSVIRHSREATIVLHGHAIEIDRTTKPPTIRGNFQTEEK